MPGTGRVTGMPFRSTPPLRPPGVPGFGRQCPVAPRQALAQRLLALPRQYRVPGATLTWFNPACAATRGEARLARDLPRGLKSTARRSNVYRLAYQASIASGLM
jgi:hypothetical protein